MIVSYGDEVGIGDDLTEALGDVLGVDPDIPPRLATPARRRRLRRRGPTPSEPDTAAEQIASCWPRAQAAFDEADAALADRRHGHLRAGRSRTPAAVERAVGLAEQPRQPAAPRVRWSRRRGG